ncbi:DUF4376 domain-containing protein (plasmid) [Pseudomonas yamanorum]|nr:DUF4376 domain-containing protein [Pseudomonas yamanorum]
MKTYARIQEGVVVEFVAPFADADGNEVPISLRFTPDYVTAMVDVSAIDPRPELGWTYKRSKFAPPQAHQPTDEEQVALIAAERFRRESAGVMIDDLVIDTSRDSQSLVAGTAISALMDANYTCNFKAVGGFVEISAPRILEISAAVRAHVQACFDRELVLLKAVRSRTFTDSMLAEGWPPSIINPVQGAAQ